MPEISRFFGMIIETLSLLSGHLPPRALGLVAEWAATHQKELHDNWDLARRHLPLKAIAPLE